MIMITGKLINVSYIIVQFSWKRLKLFVDNFQSCCIHKTPMAKLTTMLNVNKTPNGVMVMVSVQPELLGGELEII